MKETRFANSEWQLNFVNQPEAAKQWLANLGVRAPERGVRDLRDLNGKSNDPGIMAQLVRQFHGLLPACPDPDMALTNLERYVSACPDPDATLKLLAANPRTTEILVQLFSTSQHFSELMIRDPGLLDWLRGEADRRDRDTLIADLWNDLAAARNEESERLIIRQFRQRELLRIGYNDIIRGMPLEVVTLDLSHLADACVETACRLARRRAEFRHGPPSGQDGETARFVVLALGKLGGEELNYSSDIDLIFLYDVEGQTDGPRVVSNAEFFAKMGGDVVRILSDHTSLGIAYRVDMRLRPEGEQGALARSLAATLGYYETSGRTWERQALIKCRPIAGDLDLGRAFIESITPFVYRRYLSGAEIGEIKAMKRKIEQRTVSAGTASVEVKTGHGGIRDVEFVVQFLQLLHGGSYTDVRHPNTLQAVSQLEVVGCLTAEERGIMEDTYRFLRRVEHRLQTMFDRQTHEMPRGLDEQRILAIRMGYPLVSVWEDRTGPAQRFLTDYRAKTELNRKILNHLLHDAFRDDDGDAADPVVDLVLDPDPDPGLVTRALGNYPFQDRPTAYQNLMALAREDFPFLSQARCRHFLAAIAPRLLQAVSQAPDPDMALTNLEKVSASLGAKAILWELFNFNPPTLRLFVELCATSQFLSEILINNPGMIDELMDSLVIDRPQPAQAIKAELAELCRGAEDLAPILLSFRNKEWLRIGIRDILGREPIRDVTRELADVAEAIVNQVARNRWEHRAEKYGLPHRASDGKRSRWAIVGLGKLGGRELNYHSDLDLVFLHEADGETRGGFESISNEQFVNEVVRRVLKALGGDTSSGSLYHVDTRLRPHGTSGPLVVTLAAFRDYFRDSAQPWERLALTRSRILFSNGGFGREVQEVIQEISASTTLDPHAFAREVMAMRRKLEEGRARSDLKRGAGGLTDIEFLVQYLQVVHAADFPEITRPNLWDALDALRRAGLISSETHTDLREAYDFLRTVESRLRIVHNRSAHDLPEKAKELARLARRLNYASNDSTDSALAFTADADRHAVRTRALFQEVVGRAAGELA
ncbi:bifunctional [glutamate--ammonia ligase]-adenylyl-L-tyrosine phosphorylase/[glutamate--ammonia-ligase] adenylyltransferase [Singulisphaera acidiphila]|uniref:Glutamine synthetase adenylyltransferase n=1 Tax=Singulisphaera acidiphila (strain ATCC BAA-1392 / DSM 18658 / VKM B-2454 / MOB10) TaxID=886293 RepID=L0DN18_SINAD|nr:bifunctional [glutamate--ammonia ligase]-adenylyl-L-tyrosine phosphorylase/[glutamate--ammonia-ligase] adenylyltransferase [Singulisphaera acidiphila]AGA30066.1 glutamine synthetase adenylyltransferase [Singulisphaera acidiphila DSM 18658]